MKGVAIILSIVAFGFLTFWAIASALWGLAFAFSDTVSGSFLLGLVSAIPGLFVVTVLSVAFLLPSVIYWSFKKKEAPKGRRDRKPPSWDY